jgi:predicted RNA binding protein YcfA (HicA-like mRNA interferase family)
LGFIQATTAIFYKYLSKIFLFQEIFRRNKIISGRFREMRKLVVSGKEVLKALLKNGFVLIRSKGSHHRLARVVNGKEYRVTINIHGNRDLYLRLLKSIQEQSGMSEEEFERIFE